jgi:hypothetical protein
MRVTLESEIVLKWPIGPRGVNVCAQVVFIFGIRETRAWILVILLHAGNLWHRCHGWMLFKLLVWIFRQRLVTGILGRLVLHCYGDNLCPRNHFFVLWFDFITYSHNTGMPLWWLVDIFGVLCISIISFAKILPNSIMGLIGYIVCKLSSCCGSYVHSNDGWWWQISWFNMKTKTMFWLVLVWIIISMSLLVFQALFSWSQTFIGCWLWFFFEAVICNAWIGGRIWCYDEIGYRFWSIWK